MKQDMSEIVLRPRFKIELDKSKTTILKAFILKKETQSDFIINCIDDHVFIKLPREKQQFWSPQLQLEVIEYPETTPSVHGLFGPRPGVWTLFMFIHFVIGFVFLGLGVFAYTQHNLNKPISIYIWLLGLLIIFWFSLYAIGRMGKHSCKDEMTTLYNFMKTTIKQA